MRLGAFLLLLTVLAAAAEILCIFSDSESCPFHYRGHTHLRRPIFGCLGTAIHYSSFNRPVPGPCMPEVWVLHSVDAATS